MYVVRVVPLARLPASAPQVLDYFWAEQLPVGALVRITMGRRSVSAIVVECTDVARAKMALRDASFQLKKLSAVLAPTPQLSPRQLALAQWLAQQYACGLATAIHAVAPAFLGKRGKAIPNGSTDGSTESPRSEPLSDPIVPQLILTQPDTARSTIASLLSATKGQALLLVPEQHLADSLAASARDDRTVSVVHSDIGARAQWAAYRSVLDDPNHVVVGTRSALHLPWTALRHIIVEDPQHEAYKSDTAPRLNAADEARQLAVIHDATLTYLSPSLSITNRYLASRDALTIVKRKPHWPSVTLTTATQEALDGNRSLLSRAAQDALWDAYRRNAPALVYSARKAYSSLAACQQCRSSITCSTCDVPMRYHRTSEDMLVCYHCAAYERVPRRCAHCTRGIIAPAGLAGSQKIAESVRRFFDGAGVPALDVPVLDADLATDTDYRAAVWKRVDAAPWPVVVASSMVLSYRYERSFDTIIVPQADALMTSPDFRTEERLIRQLEMLADMGPRTMVLQAWESSPIWDTAVNRAWDDWAATELTARKSLRWPPFCRVIRLTYRHRDRGAASRSAAAAVDKLRRAIAHERLTGTELFGPTPTLVEHAAGVWTQSIIIKTNLSGPSLVRLTRYIPPGWTVDVDPRSIT
jgi:primosomal protein N' (replication factor Y)